MADLAASNVTVTLTPKDIDFVGMGKVSFPVIAFGNGALTYPANGVPLPAIGALGMKRAIKRVFIEGMPGDGYVYKYDRTNHTIRIWQGAGFTPAGTVAAPTFTGSALAVHNHDMKVIGGAAGGIDEAMGVEGTDTLAKDAAVDRTIVGADAATKGGVVGIGGGTPAGTNSAPAFTGAAVAAGALVEMGNVAVAAKTLYLMVLGE